LRLRFVPPKGRVYGPTDLAQRQAKSERRYEAEAVLNPESPWCGWRPLPNPGGGGFDWRSRPEGQYASEDPFDAPPRSLGLIDDTSDGIVRCEIRRLGLTAFARVVVTPPDFAPDRRPVVTVADGLFDRAAVNLERAVRDADAADSAAAEEVLDLFERVAETVSGMNLDYENRRHRIENERAADLRGLPRDQVRGFPFDPPPPYPGEALPLTRRATAQHRRLLALSVLMALLREQPGLLDQWLRPPADSSPFYDTRMPALMRGSDAAPLRLTRAQFERVRRWAAALKKGTDVGT
jgi:hypothetical protein